MSEQQPSKPPEDTSTALVRPSKGSGVPGPSESLTAIDKRLGDCPIDDLAELVRQRGILLRQEQWAVQLEHGRVLDDRELDHRVKSEQRSLTYKHAFGAGVFGTGVVLIAATPFVYPALFCMGFGMYLVAPDYVKEFMKSARGRDDQND